MKLTASVSSSEIIELNVAPFGSNENIFTLSETDVTFRIGVVSEAWGVAMEWLNDVPVVIYAILLDHLYSFHTIKKPVSFSDML